MTSVATPALSVVIPTFNNAKVVKRCLEAWARFGEGLPIELIAIEDGCRDETPEVLDAFGRTPWGSRHFRWVHEDNRHELGSTNRGFAEARGALLMAWQDDMFLQCSWLPRELVATFERYPELGMLCLSRGLNCLPLEEPIATYADLTDWRRLQSTIGPRPWNWMQLQEVDIVVRPWVVRRACVESVGVLDEAFTPTEWDEADLAFRVRRAGWHVATHGYERDGAYFHLGSTTIGRTPSEKHLRIALRNGLLFHERWDETIRATYPRARRQWRRQAPIDAWAWTLAQAVGLRVAGDAASATATVSGTRAEAS